MSGALLLLGLSGAAGYLIAPAVQHRPYMPARARPVVSDIDSAVEQHSKAELEEMAAFEAALQAAAKKARDPASIASIVEAAKGAASTLRSDDAVAKKLESGGAAPKGKVAKELKKPKGTLALIGEGVKLEVMSMGGMDLNDPAYLSLECREGGAALVCVSVSPRVALSDDALSQTVQEQETARGQFPGPLGVVARDDFVDPAQLAAAAVGGAKAVLINAAFTGEAGPAALVAEAERLGLEAIVRVADETEMEAALAAGAKMVAIGDNNLEAATELLSNVPAGVVTIADLPTRDVRGVWQVRDAGFNALIVGSGLLDVCVRDRVPPTAVIKAMLSKGSVKYGLGMQKGRLEGSKENLGTIAM